MTAAGKASNSIPIPGRMKKTIKTWTRKGGAPNEVHPRANDGLGDILFPAGPHDSAYEADNGPHDQAQSGNRHGHPEPFDKKRQAPHQFIKIETPHSFISLGLNALP
jgi:hypothetical protein